VQATIVRQKPLFFKRRFVLSILVKIFAMTDNFYLVLAAILILPLIPALIIYKFLPVGKPEDTDISGPFSGLSLKLKGAFAGYFLLVVVGLVLQYAIMNNKQEKTIVQLQNKLNQKDTLIMQLNNQLAASANPVIDWHVKGLIQPAAKDGTKFFYDDGTTNNEPDGSFELIKRCIANQGIAKPPKWVCIYNAAIGFNVISLNRDVNHPDIEKYNVAFDDTKHEILIKNPIDINSKVKDSTLAIANFIELHPELRTQVMQIDPTIFEKANAIKAEKTTNLRVTERVRPQ
jgi:hypothetical protein